MALMLLIPALALNGAASPKPWYVFTPPATYLYSGRPARPRIPAGFVRAMFKAHFRLRLQLKQWLWFFVKGQKITHDLNLITQ